MSGKLVSADAVEALARQWQNADEPAQALATELRRLLRTRSFLPPEQEPVGPYPTRLRLDDGDDWTVRADRPPRYDDVTVGIEPGLLAGYLVGVLSEAARRDGWVQATVPPVVANPVRRIADQRGLPFAATPQDDGSWLITIGSAPDARPAATLRRIGWVDDHGGVWLTVPPTHQFQGGSLAPLLIDTRES